MAAPGQNTDLRSSSAARPRTPASRRRRDAAPSPRRRAPSRCSASADRRRDDRERRHRSTAAWRATSCRPAASSRPRCAAATWTASRRRPPYLLEVAATAAAEEGCSLETSVREEYVAYRFRRGDLAVRLARQALEAARHHGPRRGGRRRRRRAHLQRPRHECVVLTSGMERIHGPGERILAADVDRLSGHHGRARRRGAGVSNGSGRSMKVGVVTEIKADEYRVALTPAGARELALHGHEVLVERGAGIGSAFADADYEARRRDALVARGGLGRGRAAAEGEGAAARGVPAHPRPGRRCSRTCTWRRHRS